MHMHALFALLFTVPKHFEPEAVKEDKTLTSLVSSYNVYWIKKKSLRIPNCNLQVSFALSTDFLF